MYETFLMFLLGYGLVQYPRHLWMQSNLDYYLLRTQMRASSDFKAIGESQLNISLVVADVMKTKAEVQYTYIDRQTDRQTHTHDSIIDQRHHRFILCNIVLLQNHAERRSEPYLNGLAIDYSISATLQI